MNQSRRRLITGMSLALISPGCVTVNRETSPAGVDAGGDEITEAPSRTAIEAGGGGGAGISTSDYPLVRSALRDEINARRSELDGAPAVDDEGSLAERLNEMAGSHAQAMHEAGQVVIELEASDLLDELEKTNCAVQRDENTFTYNGEELVIVDAVDTSGAAPGEIARALVAAWLERDRARRLLLADEARYIGVGLAIRGTTLLVAVVFC